MDRELRAYVNVLPCSQYTIRVSRFARQTNRKRHRKESKLYTLQGITSDPNYAEKSHKVYHSNRDARNAIAWFLVEFLSSLGKFQLGTPVHEHRNGLRVDRIAQRRRKGDCGSCHVEGRDGRDFRSASLAASARTESGSGLGCSLGSGVPRRAMQLT